jgi:hypothetical protein
MARSRGRPAMRPNRLKPAVFAIWLGMIALGFNALVPVHLVFGLAIDSSRSAECGRHADGEDAWRNRGWRLLALLTGHIGRAGQGDPRHGAHQPAKFSVCGTILTLAGFAPAAGAILPAPVRVEETHTPVISAGMTPQQTPLVRYRSRAPPGEAAASSA